MSASLNCELRQLLTDSNVAPADHRGGLKEEEKEVGGGYRRFLGRSRSVRSTAKGHGIDEDEDTLRQLLIE